MKMVLLLLIPILGCKTAGTALLGAGIGTAVTGAAIGIVTEAKTGGADQTTTGVLVGAGALMILVGALLATMPDRPDDQEASAPIFRRPQPPRSSEPLFRPKKGTATSTVPPPKRIREPFQSTE